MGLVHIEHGRVLFGPLASEHRCYNGVSHELAIFVDKI